MVTSEFKRGVLESRGDNQFTHVVSTTTTREPVGSVSAERRSDGPRIARGPVFRAPGSRGAAAGRQCSAGYA